ncbi:MAG TPA: cytochrome c family protein [Candidatus Eisenbacteria bacterium]|jgi:cytochrome c1
MHRKMLVQGILLATLAVAVAAQVAAYPQFARKTKVACAGCHVNPAGGAELSEAGKLFKSDETKVPAAVAGADYVGSNKCRMCHMKQYKAWTETKHAKALVNLKNADPKAAAGVAAALKVELKGNPADNQACVGCHVTGYQLTGGYPAADSVKTAAVMNVTCEACHGPGGKHYTAAAAEKKKFINRAVTAKMCTQCHTAETSPKFDFEAYKKRGVHPVAVVTK